MDSQITTGVLVNIFGQEAGEVLRVQHLEQGGGVSVAEDVVDGGDEVGFFVVGGRCVVVIRMGAERVGAAFVAVTVALGFSLVKVEVLGGCL